MALRR